MVKDALGTPGLEISYDWTLHGSIKNELLKSSTFFMLPISGKVHRDREFSKV